MVVHRMQRRSGDRRMLKGREIVVGFALASVFWVFVMVLSSDPSATYQICETNQYSGKESCSPHHLLYVVFWYGGYIFNTNTILALATAAIAYFTWTIKIINDEQLRHNISVERSYLWPGFGKHELMADGRMRWFVTVTNTGRIAGVLKVIRYARITYEEYEAGGFKFDIFTNREDVIPPGTGNPGQPTGLDFVIDKPMVCCGWIEFEDIFGRDRRQGWKHHLRLTEDSAGNWSIPFPDCYSAAYTPWEGAETTGEENQQ
jgi:hypothetical protein